MRILFISSLYPPHELGGMEQLCQEAVAGLRARGHDCHVLTSRFGVQRDDPPEPGVTRALHLQADVYHYRPLDFFLRRPAQERANRRALLDVIETFRPDLVYIWGLWNLSQAVAFWAEQRMPKRVAYAVAGYWFIEPDVHTSYWQQPAGHPVVRLLSDPVRKLALWTLERSQRGQPLELQHVACVSAHVRDRMTTAGVLPHGAHIIYNGVDPLPFVQASAARAVAPGQLRMIYVGGLVEHKGVHTAIEALGLLQQQHLADGLSLTLVGGGHPDYIAELQQRIADHGLQEHVTFSGRVPRDQVAALLIDHDVFLFTSVWEEPIARTVMEAMAAGTVVIGTPVGGQREMLEDGVNALVYPAGDAAALAEAILRLRRNPGLCTHLATAGRATVLQRFTLDRMVDEIEAWLGSIGNENPAL